MASMIIVFSKAEEARAVKNVLVRSGFQVGAVCTRGSAALQAADRLGEGIIVCGYRLGDMLCTQLYELVRPAFAMLTVAGSSVCDDLPPGIWHLPLPVRTLDLVQQLNLMQEELLLERRKKRRQAMGRSRAQNAVLARAKELLMKNNRMTEEEAHRYLQKTSMENGSSMAETASMLISLMEQEN